MIVSSMCWFTQSTPWKVLVILFFVILDSCDLENYKRSSKRRSKYSAWFKERALFLEAMKQFHIDKFDARMKR